MSILRFLLALFLTLHGLWGTNLYANVPASGLYHIESEGVDRAYYLYVPDKPLRKNNPVVVVLHGLWGSAQKFFSTRFMVEEANKQGAILVYAEGLLTYPTILDVFCEQPFSQLGNSVAKHLFTLACSGILHTVADVPQGLTLQDQVGVRPWSATHPASKLAPIRRPIKDDVLFLRNLLSSLQTAYPDYIGDHNFLLGTHAGGFMALQVACQAPDLFRAVAASTATFTAKIHAECSPSQPVPLLLVNPDTDSSAGMEWDKTITHGLFGMTELRSPNLPILKTIDFWQNHNQCQGTMVQDPVDSMGLERSRYTQCQDGSEVHSYKVFGMQHSAMGLIQNIPNGEQLHRHLSHAVWEFFEPYLLP